MASRPKGFGLTRELDDKMRAKYSIEDEREIVSWISARTGRQMSGEGQDDFRDFLLDGTVLCELINSFNLPGVECKANTNTAGIKLAAMRNMKESENIERFLKAAEKLGMKRLDMFQTVNIRDNTNMSQVLSTLYSLGSTAGSKGVSGPMIGTKYAEKNQREFDEATQRAGRSVIGLQMGTNQVASQRGMTGYGQGRQIVHDTN